MRTATPLLALALMAAITYAKTDLRGCVSSETVNQWNQASLLWYLPDTGEICDFVDCGGGRAPPKTTVPGCPGYGGTATVTPSFIPGYKGALTGLVPSATFQSYPATTSSPAAVITSAATLATSSSANPDTSSAANTAATSTGSSIVASQASSTILTSVNGSSFNSSITTNGPPPTASTTKAASHAAGIESLNIFFNGAIIVFLSTLALAL